MAAQYPEVISDAGAVFVLKVFDFIVLAVLKEPVMCDAGNRG